VRTSKRSRTPHLDRAIERRSGVARVRRWRRLNPGAEKIRQNQLDDHSASYYARAEFKAGHTHRCLECRQPYTCSNACDPLANDLKNSVCDKCFEEVLSQCSSGHGRGSDARSLRRPNSKVPVACR